MRRRTVCILAILAISLAALAGLLFFRGPGSGSGRLSRRMTDEASFDRLTEGRAEDPDLVSEFLCNGVVLPGGDGAFYYSMREGDTMDPVVEVRGREALTLTFARRSLDAQTLRGGEGLPFIACSKTAYCTGVLYLTSLPVMSITVTEPDAAGSYEIYDRIDRDAKMLLYDNRAGVPDTARINSSETTIRIRGNTSAVLPKQSYRLSLFTVSTGLHRRHNNLSLLGMRADEDWILYSGGTDSEHIRNALSNNLWFQSCAANNFLGVKPGVECRFVELVMNGRYMGLYTLMYPLDKKAVSLPDDGFYYRGASYAETTAEMLSRAKDERIVGGWELRYPASTAGRNCWECLRDYFANIYTHEEDADLNWYWSRLDRNNVIDLHLFLTLLNGRDNYYKNNNVLVYPVASTYYDLLAPWDLDLTWGHDYSADSDWRIASELTPPDQYYNPWSLPGSRMAALSPDFRAMMLARWHELRQGEWSDAALSALFDSYEQQVFGSGAMARDQARWPDAPHARDLSELRDWTGARLVYLDGYFEEVLGQ